VALTQEIVAGSVLPITGILTIEDHKLNNTSLHVAFRSQSLLKPIGDQTGSYTNWRTGEDDQRGGWMGVNQNSYARIGLYPKFKPKAKIIQESDKHTNQHHRNDLRKVMNTAKK
jgi:hypothetical protein